ncbi:MAG: HAMP domain-containing protein, partial [Clostridia bacterium]|nr:HAMP domain-containing protein [Clostridia bacterium]
GSMETGKFNISGNLFDEPVRVLILDTHSYVCYDNSTNASLTGKFYVPGTKVISEANTGTSSWAVTDNEDGTHSMEVAIPVKKVENIIGFVFLKKSLNDADLYLKDIRSTLLILTLVTSLLMALMSFLLANVITSPLIRLTKAVEEISEGEFNQKVEVIGHDEIARLGESFNNMTGKLTLMEEKRKQFVSDASHELKTPLATIRLSCESAKAALSSGAAGIEMADEFMDDITGEIDRLNRIIEKLLAMTKNDSQVVRSDITTVDLHNMIVSVIKKLSPLAREKNISLSFVGEDDENHIQMLADYDKLYEAVYNIADNSIKYTNEDGMVKITLRGDITKTIIEIEDNGIGIPKDQEGLIFDRFYRVDRARARDTGGTGLGLSIANDAIQAHGGHIELISSEGVGSKFIIVLPYSGK